MSGEYADQDPNGGGDTAPVESAPVQPAQPVGRTYTDQDMAAARRSFERDAAQRESRLRADFESRFVAREQPKPTSPWSDLLAPDIEPKFQAALDAAIAAKLAPYQQNQEELAFSRDEAEIKAKYKDYTANRVDILNFAVENEIVNLDTAYRAWKYDELSKIDPEKIGRDAVAKHVNRKAAQSAGTPSVEGRGGGAPSSKQSFQGKDGKLDRDAMDRAAEEMFRSANETNS